MTLLLLIGATLAYGGLAANSQAMDRHYADIHGRGKEPGFIVRRLCRTCGWSGILASLAVCVGASGWHTGPVLWCGMLTAAAIVLTLLLQYTPRSAVRAGWIALAMVPLLAVASQLPV